LIESSNNSMTVQPSESALSFHGPEAEPLTEKNDAFPDDLDRGLLAETLTLTDRRLRRLIRVLNEGQDRSSEELQVELLLARRQARKNREIREIGGE
jgi:hypothetical protein